MKIQVKLVTPADGLISGELTLPPAFWRAHFAGLAMAGIMAHPDIEEPSISYCVDQADALLAELGIGEGGGDGD